MNSNEFFPAVNIVSMLLNAFFPTKAYIVESLFLPFFQCNVPCGNGFQYRHVLCHDEDGHESPEAKCLKYDPKPALQKACERPACPVWKTEEWGEVRMLD